jgi:hypothetical protein
MRIALVRLCFGGAESRTSNKRNSAVGSLLQLPLTKLKQ